MNIAENLIRMIQVISMTTYRSRTRIEILNELAGSGFEISDRTFDRIISDIKGLGFTVNTNKGFGYKITDSEEDNYDLKMILNLNTLLISRHNLDKISPSMLSEFILQNHLTIGIKHIPIILDSIIKSTKLKFTYCKFAGQISTVREVIPLKLVEDSHRWYLVAYDENKDGVRVFGIDRIDGIEQSEIFNRANIPPSILAKADLYYHKIGVSPELFTENPDKIYEITLAVRAIYLPYISTKKLHHSQIITNEITNGFTLVKIKVIPTRDLLRHLSSELGDIKIVEPNELINYIKKERPELINILLLNERGMRQT